MKTEQSFGRALAHLCSALSIPSFFDLWLPTTGKESKHHHSIAGRSTRRGPSRRGSLALAEDSKRCLLSGAARLAASFAQLRISQSA